MNNSLDRNVEIHSQSREIIAGWGIKDAEDYAVAANITARKSKAST